MSEGKLISQLTVAELKEVIRSVVKEERSKVAKSKKLKGSFNAGLKDLKDIANRAYDRERARQRARYDEKEYQKELDSKKPSKPKEDDCVIPDSSPIW